MQAKELMSGIAVAIDDALGDEPSNGGDDQAKDTIEEIIHWFETEWRLSFVKVPELPKENLWQNLLGAASFVLLDWRLWPARGYGISKLKKTEIDRIKAFLTSARENLVPVFILTNESLEDVKEELVNLPSDVYLEGGTNFVLIEQKAAFWNGASVDVERLESWVYGNASVYALKAWGRVIDGAKRELFQAMCRRNVNWPRVFWEAFKEDKADPSASLTNLITDSLRGRMPADAFEEVHLGGTHDDSSDEELRRLIAETSFRVNSILPADEVRCGDLYKGTGGKYWLNVRPDCDCIPRGEEQINDVQVYCVQGKKISLTALSAKFNREYGNFEENIAESIVFGVLQGKSLLFNFAKLRVCKYSEFREGRLGRLLHPYLTRVQQRYALYLQRQALPRIPNAAVPDATTS